MLHGNEAQAVAGQRPPPDHRLPQRVLTLLVSWTCSGSSSSPIPTTVNLEDRLGKLDEDHEIARDVGPGRREGAASSSTSAGGPPWPLSPRRQRRVMTAIEQCRTAVLGGHIEQCDQTRPPLRRGRRAPSRRCPPGAEVRPMQEAPRPGRVRVRGRIEEALRRGGGRPGGALRAGPGARERSRAVPRAPLVVDSGGGEVVTGMTTEALAPAGAEPAIVTGGGEEIVLPQVDRRHGAPELAVARSGAVIVSSRSGPWEGERLEDHSCFGARPPRRVAVCGGASRRGKIHPAGNAAES